MTRQQRRQVCRQQAKVYIREHASEHTREERRGFEKLLASRLHREIPRGLYDPESVVSRIVEPGQMVIPVEFDIQL